MYGINELVKGLVRERTVGYLFLEPPRGGGYQLKLVGGVQQKVGVLTPLKGGVEKSLTSTTPRTDRQRHLSPEATTH